MHIAWGIRVDDRRMCTVYGDYHRDTPVKTQYIVHTRCTNQMHLSFFN